MDKKNTKVITGECVLSYLNCWEPKGYEGSEPKYSVSLVIDKKDTKTINAIKEAIRNAYDNGKQIMGNVSFERMKNNPLRDGDEERADDPVYAGKYFVNASSKNQPGIVDRYRQEILDRGEMYSGVIGRAAINFYAFNKAGNNGVGCGLLNLQKLRDGQPLDGHSKAENDFDDGYGESLGADESCLD